MLSTVRKPLALLAALAVSASFLFLGASAPQARADGEFLDIAGKPIQFHSVKKDGITGQTSNQQVPLDKLPDPAREILSTPPSVALDQMWSGQIPKLLCDQLPASLRTGPASSPCGSISKQLCDFADKSINGQGTGSFHANYTTCTVPQSGRTTASQQGDKTIVSYYLPGNLIQTYVSTPVTCAPDHGTIFCPTDPKFSLTADFELRGTIATPGNACDAHVDPFTVQVLNVNIDSQDYTADVAKSAAEWFAGLLGLPDPVVWLQGIISQYVTNWNNDKVLAQQSVMTKIAALTSGLCKMVLPNLPSGNDIWLLTGSVDAGQGIGFQLLDQQPTPSFARATINPAQGAVSAGNTLKLDGQIFPASSTVTLTWGGPTSAGSLGTATTSGQGTFSTTVTIPADLAPGTYNIHAEATNAKADAGIQVLSASSRQRTLTVSSFGGLEETSITTDYPYTLTGNNFAPLFDVSIHVDSTDGPLLGTVTAALDATFKMNLVVTADQIGNSYGAHKLVAESNGFNLAERTYTFIKDEAVH